MKHNTPSTLVRLLSSALVMGFTATAVPAFASGSWEITPAYTDYQQMVQLGDRLYIRSSSGNLFTYDIDDATTQALSRLDGLSGTSVVRIVGNDDHSCMAIIYSNGDINLMRSNGSISNLPDLKNKNLSNKSVNNAQIVGSKLYISTDYGFSVVDLDREIFTESYIFNEACLFAFDFNDRLYMATKTALYTCLPGKNAFDRTEWQTVCTGEMLSMAFYPYEEETRVCVNFKSSTAYNILPDGSLTKFLKQSYIKYVGWMGDHLLLCSSCCNYIDTQNEVVTPNCTDIYANCKEFIPAGDSLYYALSPENGLLKIKLDDFKAGNTFSFTEVADEVHVSGPASEELYSLDFTNGYLYGIQANPQVWDDTDFTAGILSTYDSETGLWSNETVNTLSGMPYDKYAFQGLTSLAADPTNTGRCAIGNLYCGLYIVEGDSVVAHYDESNSNLEKYWRERVTALAYGDDGTLWVGNACQNSASLKALLPDGTWMAYPIDGFDGGRYLFVTDILVSRNDPYQFKWACKTSAGCAIYYDGGTPGDLSDDEYCYFNSLTDQDGNTLTPETYNALAEDNNGAVWILTSMGPFVSDSPISTYNGKGTVRRIKIPRNDGTNLADYLLANVDTRCMVVDAANRKWIGTANNGLYLLSADGLTTIEHFTTDNSPLFSDNIISLAIDNETGRLFISTSGGVLTYSSDAVSGATDFSAVYCYPNPVRPEYSGDLCITGLMDATQVRITDIANNVVFAAISAGGSVTWNLCNRSGKRVKPGVYLVYGVDEAGKKGMVCKVLVVR
jgi:hypothetical protein